MWVLRHSTRWGRKRVLMSLRKAGTVESTLTISLYECGILHRWMRHVTDVNAARHTCEFTTSHIACQYVRKRAVCLNPSALHLHKWKILEPTKEACHTNERDIPRMWMKYCTRVNEVPHACQCALMNKPCRTHKRVASHVQSASYEWDVSHENESCLIQVSGPKYTHKRVKSHVQNMSHTQISAVYCSLRCNVL